MLDPKFSVTVSKETDNYAQITIEPLKQGYGHTLGNALRRVLLSSLPGAAITSVKVKGVNHQFSTLAGMSEDIVQLILNIKTIRVKMKPDLSEATLKLEAKGPGEVTSGQIKGPVGVEITNPEVVLAHLSDKKSTLQIEFKVETGVGYSLAEERKTPTIGIIPVDALFSPVKRVNPHVQATRVGRRTDFDKLTLEIWTDGTISAKDSLDTASQILVEHFQHLINPGEIEDTGEDSIIGKYPNETLSLTVEELDLPTRIANALRKGGYKTVADLQQATKSDIAKVKNLGERSVSLVENALIQKDVSLADSSSA